jgi:hypothetical protein
MQMRRAPIFCKVKWKKAIKEMRNKKATGDDDVPGDVPRLFGEGGLKIMKKLINTIYETGEWPKDFMEVTMIALKKKPQATKCSDHCTVSLIAHTAKIVAKILRRRIEKKIEDVLKEEEELRKKLVKCYIWSIALYGAETWTLRALDKKHL